MDELNKILVTVIVILVVTIGLMGKSNNEKDRDFKNLVNQANDELSEYDREYRLLNQSFYELYAKYVDLYHDYSSVSSNLVYWQSQSEYWEQQYWDKPYYQYNLTSFQRFLENVKNTKTAMSYGGNFYLSLENLNVSTNSGILFSIMKAEYLYYFVSNKTVELELVNFESGGYAFAFLGMMKGNYAKISVKIENQTSVSEIVLKNVLLDDGSFIKTFEYEQEG